MCLTDQQTTFKRLCRGKNFNLKNIESQITNGIYSDYHMLRPYEQYTYINNKILDLLSSGN